LYIVSFGCGVASSHQAVDSGTIVCCYWGATWGTNCFGNSFPQMVSKFVGRKQQKTNSGNFWESERWSLKVGSRRTPRAKGSPPMLKTQQRSSIINTSCFLNSRCSFVLLWHATGTVQKENISHLVGTKKSSTRTSCQSNNQVFI
jgi:hypothetical protein